MTERCAELLESELQNVQCKAAHNSVDREESLLEQLQWNPAAPHESGCRGIELDLVQGPISAAAEDPWTFKVQHGKWGLRSRAFGDCLSDLQQWAGMYPDHDLLIIHLDLKNYTLRGDDAAFPHKLDAILEEYFQAAQLFTPGDLFSHAGAAQDTPLANAAGKGWPTLGELRGRFLFVISGDETKDRVHRRKQSYAASRPRERRAFVDVDQRLPGDVVDQELELGERVILNLHFGTEGWEARAREAAAAGLLTRIWVANSAESLAAALAAGVNVVSTDKVRGHDWASVASTEPFRLRACAPPSAVSR
jgi:hypothetical protein